MNIIKTSLQQCLVLNYTNEVNSIDHILVEINNEHVNHLPRQTGTVGVKLALFPSVACVQVATARPMSSNPVLQVYVAVSPTELPADVTSPLLGLLGLEHRAAENNNPKIYTDTKAMHNVMS